MDGNSFIENYYYEFETLPPLFFQKIIDLENALYSESNVELIMDLGYLYKVNIFINSVGLSISHKYHMIKLNILITNYKLCY